MTSLGVAWLDPHPIPHTWHHSCSPLTLAHHVPGDVLPSHRRLWAWLPVTRAGAGEAGQSLITPNVNLDLLSLGQSHSTVPGDPESRGFYRLQRTAHILYWGVGWYSGSLGLVGGSQCLWHRLSYIPLLTPFLRDDKCHQFLGIVEALSWVVSQRSSLLASDSSVPACQTLLLRFSLPFWAFGRCASEEKSLCCFNLGGNQDVHVLAHPALLGLSFQGNDLSSVMSVEKALPRSTPCRCTPGCTQASGPTPAPCVARLSPPSTRCWST